MTKWSGKLLAINEQDAKMGIFCLSNKYYNHIIENLKKDKYLCNVL